MNRDKTSYSDLSIRAKMSHIADSSLRGTHLLSNRVVPDKAVEEDLSSRQRRRSI